MPRNLAPLLSNDYRKGRFCLQTRMHFPSPGCLTSSIHGDGLRVHSHVACSTALPKPAPSWACWAQVETGGAHQIAIPLHLILQSTLDEPIVKIRIDLDPSMSQHMECNVTDGKMKISILEVKSSVPLSRIHGGTDGGQGDHAALQLLEICGERYLVKDLLPGDCCWERGDQYHPRDCLWSLRDEDLHREASGWEDDRCQAYGD
ncbi:uncharacterized protein LOC123343421 [Mauremys mutica]|uniref:uncharacterized protein LOC123343421 n=1 Tax=Mauremys mutica TaxID=74926 RepID=UPI001D14A1AB|nr:uncharacterized protein LOC123343421 [Mauremys mutica]